MTITRRRRKPKDDGDGETVTDEEIEVFENELEEWFCSEDWMDEHSNWRYYINGEEYSY